MLSNTPKNPGMNNRNNNPLQGLQQMLQQNQMPQWNGQAAGPLGAMANPNIMKQLMQMLQQPNQNMQQGSLLQILNMLRNNY